MQQQDPQHQEPSQAKVYVESRKRDPKKKYKTDFTKTKDNIAQMEALRAQYEKDGSEYRDPYYDVIKKPAHSGRVPLYGYGVTKTLLKKKGKQTGLIYPQQFLHDVQRDLILKIQEANPGVNLVLPESVGGNSSSDASMVKPVAGNSSAGHSSISAGKQVQNELNGSNNEAMNHGEDLEG